MTPEIEESGGVAWSEKPYSPLPESPGARVKVTLEVGATHKIDEEMVRRLVAAAKPAHVIAEVEVVAMEAVAT